MFKNIFGLTSLEKPGLATLTCTLFFGSCLMETCCVLRHCTAGKIMALQRGLNRWKP